jgi:hypothetical protein
LYHLNAETKTWTSLGEGTLNMNEGKDEDGNKKYRLGMLLRTESPLSNYTILCLPT